MKKRITLAISCVMLLCMMLAGCAKTGSDSSVWNFKYRGTSLDISEPYVEMIKKAVAGGPAVMDFERATFYDENGEVSKLKWTEATGEKYERENLMFVHLWQDKNCAVSAFTADAVTGNLKNFKSSDGFSSASKESDVTDKFVFVSDYNLSGSARAIDLNNYTALVIDGKYVDISDKINNLPATLSDEDLEYLSNLKYTVGNACSRMLPDGMVSAKLTVDDWQSKYESEEAFRSACALMYAIEDTYNSFCNGEIENFGTISYAFKDGVIESVEFISANHVSE